MKNQKIENAYNYLLDQILQGIEYPTAHESTVLYFDLNPSESDTIQDMYNTYTVLQA